MKPIIVDIHYLLANKTTREYAFFFRVDFNNKEIGVAMEGPFKIIPDKEVHIKDKWEQMYVLLFALSRVRQRIRASEPAPDRPILVYTDYAKFAKYLVNYPNNVGSLPPLIAKLISNAVKDLGVLDMQLTKDTLPWRLRYNGRAVLRKYLSGGIEQNVIQQKFTIPTNIGREQQAATTTEINEGEDGGRGVQDIP